MHVAHGRGQGVDPCFFYELSRFSWSREPFTQVARGVVDLGTAANVANLAFHKNLRSKCFDRCAHMREAQGS